MIGHRLFAAALAAGVLAIAPALAQQSQQSQNSTAQGASANPSTLSGQQITQIQEKLKQEKLYKGNADGKWGPETEQAVKEYQQKNNLPATGDADQQTLSKLGVQAGQ